jgi:uncharacterized protein (TIGR03083 family)
MPVTVDRDHILPILRREYAAIADLCAALDGAEWDLATCLPGWTVKDVLAHIVGTEAMLNGDPFPEADISGYDHFRNDIGRSNELWVESMRPCSGPEVLERFRAVTARRLDSLDAMTQADFDAPSWTPVGPDETYGRFMRVRHFDCYFHELDIRAATGRPDPDDVAALEEALTEPAAALGYIVGRKARMPEGTTVSIRLTDPAPHTWLVEVTDRARVVDRLDADPTVRIELPPIVFLRLAGGRVPAEPTVDRDVRLGGDVELARRLATHLAYTI